ncbi:type IV pilus modification protein PilV [Pseudomonas sp. Q1-7]|uniref:type IV pilus modification protein PilV n=1 Tax=Pseudomonas sp. Q1-7 TaxID=3020843 RepID=UPI002300340F|nr:type IV pilus modification protein PilV [Pseudomonas sp. Q1-7]
MTVKTHQTGITMIEVLVTLLIFTVGLLGLAGLQLKALQGTNDSVQRAHATWLLQDFADRVYSNGVATIADYSGAAPNCNALPNPVCADFFNPVTGAKVNGSNCTPAQMASFDRWEAMCRYRDTAAYQGNAAAKQTRSNSRDFINLQALNIAARDSNGDTVNDSLDLTLSWKGKGGENSANSDGDNQSAQMTIRK